MRTGLLFALVSVTAMATAQNVEGHAPERLPIDLPKGVTVDFEVDAPGADLMPVIRQLLSGELDDPLAGRKSDDIKIKTGLGDIHVRARDLAFFLEPIREMHFITYSGPRRADTLRHYEEAFTDEGLKRDALVDGQKGLLAMHRPGLDGVYAFVWREKERVTVLRTDGLPELGEAGTIALRLLGDAAQRAIFHKKH